MMEKLGLPTQMHHQPYSLRWLKKRNKIKVEKRCLMEFSIGVRLHDQVLCDIVSMNAYHLLLNRPWKYDRKIFHVGYQNTYTFTKDEKSIMILPWRNSKDHTKVDHTTILQVKEETVRLSLLGLSEHDIEGSPFNIIHLQRTDVQNVDSSLVMLFQSEGQKDHK